MPAQMHRPDEYADTFEAHRAVQMIDDSGEMQGELVWRLATGQTVEITHPEADRADMQRGAAREGGSGGGVRGVHAPIYRPSGSPAQYDSSEVAASKGALV